MAPHLTALPPKLHLKISTHLPLPALAFLSQTCHRLHKHLSRPLHLRLIRDKTFLQQLPTDPQAPAATLIGNTLQWAASNNRLGLLTDLLTSGFWSVDEIQATVWGDDDRIPRSWRDPVDRAYTCEKTPLVMALANGDSAEGVVRVLLAAGAAVTDEETREKRLWYSGPWRVEGLSFFMEGILADEALRRAEGGMEEEEMLEGDESDKSCSETSWAEMAEREEERGEDSDESF